MASEPVSSRRFVPSDADPSRLETIRPLYTALLERDLNTARQVEAWLSDFSELTAVVSECFRRRYIDKSRHTDDAEAERRYLYWIEHVRPEIEPLHFSLQQKLMAGNAVRFLDPKKYAVLIRDWEVDVESYRPQDIPLETGVNRLVAAYNKITAAMAVDFDGKERTVRAMEAYAEQPDRGLRQRAWEAAIERKRLDEPPLEDVFDQLLGLRQQIARNAGSGNFRDVAWKGLRRFDYTPDQCRAFSESIATVVVPLVKKINARRQSALGLESLRPWDLGVDPGHRPALRPFAETDIERLVDGTTAILHRISPDLGSQFESIRRQGNLDLETRKHKQQTGYQSWLDESKRAFIFTNASGRHRDIEVLLHEAGHAFHSAAAAGVPLVFLQRAPIEFAEVASTAMELFAADHFDVFYDPADAARAKRTKLEDILTGFPSIAIYDSFQHWMYENPGHSRSRRTQTWVDLHHRFAGDIDWTGIEPALENDWLHVPHFFYVPFYYVEYGIAQVAALQLWLDAQTDPGRTLAGYRAALKLGGTVPLPELFAAAGVRFDFSESTLGPLMGAVEQELDRLRT